jgi:DNA-directed RNA polymerase subunit RPC12/RpoP
MSFIQRLFKAILPREIAERMEAESRDWMMRCPNCGYARSVWDWGGIRAGAAGNPRRRLRCPNCGQKTWHEVYKASERRGATPT